MGLFEEHTTTPDVTPPPTGQTRTLVLPRRRLAHVLDASDRALCGGIVISIQPGETPVVCRSCVVEVLAAELRRERATASGVRA